MASTGKTEPMDSSDGVPRAAADVPFVRNSIASKIGRGMLVIARFATVQAVAQGLGLVAGLILVRALDKHDYALYTLALTGINVLTMVSNGGITDAAIAIGGRAWQDPRHLGRMLASATRFRARLILVTFPPAVVVMAWLFGRNGATMVEGLVLSAAAVIAAYLQISSAILSLVLRLKGHVRQLQNLDLAGAAARLALVVCLLESLDAELATIIIAIGSTVGFVLARRWVAPLVDPTQEPDSAMLQQTFAVVRRQWVNDLAFVFQSQITLFLLGIIGGSTAVADFGALGRIAAIFGVLGAVMQGIVLPRYARCGHAAEMRTLYPVIMLSFAAVALAPVLGAMLIPRPLLWVLGVQYGDLAHELVLVTLSAGTGALAFTAWGLNSVRAWVIPAWLNVPLMFVSQGVLMALIGVSTMDRMLWVGIAWNLLSTLVSFAATLVFSRGFSRA